MKHNLDNNTVEFQISILISINQEIGHPVECINKHIRLQKNQGSNQKICSRKFQPNFQNTEVWLNQNCIIKLRLHHLHFILPQRSMNVEISNPGANSKNQLLFAAMVGYTSSACVCCMWTSECTWNPEMFCKIAGDYLHRSTSTKLLTRIHLRILTYDVWFQLDTRKPAQQPCTKSSHTNSAFVPKHCNTAANARKGKQKQCLTSWRNQYCNIARSNACGPLIVKFILETPPHRARSTFLLLVEPETNC